MAASGLDADRHRWFSDDVIKHVGRGPDGQYQLIVADPPMFGRAEGRSFALTQQLGALADGCVRKLAGGGHLVLSTHGVELSFEDLESAVRSASRGRRVEVVRRMGLPEWDHPTVGGDDAYLKTLVLRVA